MANKKTTAEQVAELTPQQQETILKVGTIALIAELIVGIPWAIMAGMGLFALMFSGGNDHIFWGFMIFAIVGILYFLGIVLFVKIKYPYYSDSKWFHLFFKKIRKK